MRTKSAVSAAKIAMSASAPPPLIARRSWTKPDVTPSRIATIILIDEVIFGVPASVALIDNLNRVPFKKF